MNQSTPNHRTPKALFNVYETDTGAWLSSFYGDDPGFAALNQEEETRFIVAWGKARDKAGRMHSPLAVEVKIHRHAPLKPRQEREQARQARIDWTLTFVWALIGGLAALGVLNIAQVVVPVQSVQNASLSIQDETRIQNVERFFPAHVANAIEGINSGEPGFQEPGFQKIELLKIEYLDDHTGADVVVSDSWNEAPHSERLRATRAIYHGLASIADPEDKRPDAHSTAPSWVYVKILVLSEVGGDKQQNQYQMVAGANCPTGWGVWAGEKPKGPEDQE